MSPLLATLLLLPVAGPAPAVALSGDDEAQAHWQRAEEDLARGRYARAYERLLELAERWPDTEVGRAAADRTRPAGGILTWRDLVRSGPAANRVDVVLMGDGYPLDKQHLFDDIAADVPAVFEHNHVFGEYVDYFNFLRANVVSPEQGVDAHGRAAATALGAHAIEGSSGDHVWVDRHTVQAELRRLPEQDGLAIVFVPRGSLGAGGYGVAVVGGRDAGMVLHQFGHAFGTLRDEHGIDNGFLGAPETWLNVSATQDPKQVPWRHWIEAGVPGIGLYEGADGRVRGAWKPTASGCRMENGDRFCPVCREALVLAIHRHVDPIESARVVELPEGRPDTVLAPRASYTFEVTVMQPRSHDLEVSWYVLPADAAPGLSGDPDVRPRTRRRALDPIEREPDATTRARRGVHRFEVTSKRLEPGAWRVLCRVRDSTLVRGEKRPWVLRDEEGLLTSERGWWIEVRE